MSEQLREALRKTSLLGEGVWPVTITNVEAKALLDKVDAADMCLDAAHEARRVLREHFGGNLAFLDDDLVRGAVKMKEEIERLRAACEAHGNALQRASEAAGLLAGADMHKELAPAIEALRADLSWLGGYLSTNYPIGRSDGWRICIGGGCGATWEEAVRAGRDLHERMKAAYLERQAKEPR